MKPLHSFECPSGHQFEKQVKWNQEQAKCPECGEQAERVYMSRRSPHQQFSQPIVLWRYKDGKLGVAGRADARTPANADRIEINNMGEYRRHMKELNAQHRSQESNQEERYQREVERLMGESNRELNRLLAQETDPAARAILREGIKAQNERAPSFREWYSEVMES